MLCEDRLHLKHFDTSDYYLVGLEHLMFWFQITEHDLRRQSLRSFAKKMWSNILELRRIPSVNWAS